MIVPPPVRVKHEPAEDVPIEIPSQSYMEKSGRLFKRFFEYEGLTKPMIDIYDNWIQHILPRQIAEFDLRLKNGTVTFGNVSVVLPTYVEKRTETVGSVDELRNLLPQIALDRDFTYSFKLIVEGQFIPYDSDVPLAKPQQIELASIPAMLGSSVCHSRGLTKEELLGIGVDPYDQLGYFIIKGAEKVLLLREALRGNRFTSYYSKAFDSIVTSMKCFTYIRSILVRIHMTKTDVIIIHLPSIALGSNMSRQKERGQQKEPIASRKKTIPMHIGVLRIFHFFGTAFPAEFQYLFNIVDIVAYILSFLQPELRSKARSILESSIIDMTIQDTNEIELFTQFFSIEGETIEDKILRIREIFDNELFARSPSTQNRLALLAFMIARHLEILTGYRKLDDRDSWIINAVSSAGKIMEMEFNTLWKKVIDKIQVNLDSKIQSPTNIFGYIQTSLGSLTEGFVSAFTSNTWEIGFGSLIDSTTIAEPFRRDFYLAGLSQLLTINIKVDRRTKNLNLRAIHPSQVGYVGVSETPDRKNCGIVKHLSVGCRISRERPEEDIDNIINVLVKNKLIVDHYNGVDAYQTSCIINGRFMGWCNGDASQDVLRTMKRKDEIPRDTCIVLGSDNFFKRFEFSPPVVDNTLYIYIDGGRLIRPLLVVDSENGRLHIDNLDEIRTSEPSYWELPFEELLKTGCIEYLDPWEQEYSYVATSARDMLISKRDLLVAQRKIAEMEEELPPKLEGLKIESEKIEQLKKQNKIGDAELKMFEDKRIELETEQMSLDTAKLTRRHLMFKNKYTHCEIDPSSIWGAPALITPLPEFSHGPRIGLVAGMVKQAMGIYHTNYLSMFAKTKALMYPTQPQFKSSIYDMVGMNAHPSGTPVMVAIMTYTGYTQEDAIVIDKGALDRGLFSYHKFSVYSTVVSPDHNSGEKLAHPDEFGNKIKFDRNLFHAITETGIPKIGAWVQEGDFIIGKFKSRQVNGEWMYENVSIRVKATDAGFIHQVLDSSNNDGNRIVKVMIRIPRVPIVGDKLSDLTSQKATIGMILRHEDMPFIATGPNSGMVPSILINPHCIPSRMTLNKIIEIIVSKAAAVTGERYDATAFRQFDPGRFKTILKSYGFNATGHEKMTSGFTGELLDAEVFVGPCYYQLLKHTVVDKIQSRGVKGAYKTDIREPIGGIGGRKGAQRFSEGDRDAVLAHGASDTLRDRLCYSADKFELTICQECGIQARYQVLSQKELCPKCLDKGVLVKVETNYALHYLVQILSGAGFQIRYQVEPIGQRTIFRNFETLGFIQANNKLKLTYESNEKIRIRIHMQRKIHDNEYEILCQDLNKGNQGYFIQRIGGLDSFNRDHQLQTLIDPISGDNIRTTYLDTMFNEIFANQGKEISTFPTGEGGAFK